MLVYYTFILYIFRIVDVQPAADASFDDGDACGLSAILRPHRSEIRKCRSRFYGLILQGNPGDGAVRRKPRPPT